MDGVFLSPTEDEFVGRIAEELENFMVQGQHQRVLLFPPLSSRLRYLIHRTVENMELLSSFSVGEGWRRRTVICHSAVRLPNEAGGDQRAGSSAARSQRPAAPWGRGGRGARLRHPGDAHGDNSRSSVGSGRISRPPRRKQDRALFVPKGIRKKANWRERESDGGDAAAGGESRPKNSGGDGQQEVGRGGGGPGKQQELEEENIPGEEENILGKEENIGEEEENIPGKENILGKEENIPGKEENIPEEEENIPGKEENIPGKEENNLGKENNIPGEEENIPGKEENIPGKENILGKEENIGEEEENIPGKEENIPRKEENIPGKEENIPGEGSAEHPVRGGKAPSLGSSRGSCEQDKHCSHSLRKHPPAAEEQESVLGGSEFQAGPGEENPPCRDSVGWERGKSCFPWEKRAGSWTDPAVPEPLENRNPRAAGRNLEIQSLENKSHPGNAEGTPGSFSTPEQEKPGAAEVGQKPLQNVLEDPGEAPELLRGGDPGVPKVPREEEEDKESSDVAQELCRSLDLAAGDGEGTRPSGPEDDCTAELLAEIVGNLTVKDVSIERISVECSSYGEAPLTEGDLGHVTEIYDFPSSLKTEDLVEMFADFHESGFKIQWVDDTHALGIFSSLSTASQALGRRYPCLKIRPLIHATRQSRIKALQRPKLLQLGKERPQTDAAVARRLVSHALGWKHRQQEAAGTEVFQPESLDQEE